MIPSFNYVLWLTQPWIPLMWIWLWYFIQHIHLCFCILKWSYVIFLSFLNHIDTGVFFHLLIFHRFIVKWRCILIHKLGLYTSYNILSLVIHWLWIWNFLQLIMYYKSPYFVLISSALNHRLQFRNIPHSFIWVSSWAHLSPWRSSFVTMPFLKTPNPYFTPYHFLW